MARSRLIQSLVRGRNLRYGARLSGVQEALFPGVGKCCVSENTRDYSGCPDSVRQQSLLHFLRHHTVASINSPPVPSTRANQTAHVAYRYFSASSARQEDPASEAQASAVAADEGVRWDTDSSALSSNAGVVQSLDVGTSTDERAFDSAPEASGLLLSTADSDESQQEWASLAEAPQGLPSLDAGDLATVAATAAATTEVTVNSSSFPVAVLESVINAAHVTTGLPWWLSIVAVTVALRLALLPVNIYQMRSTAKLSLAKEELEPLMEAIKSAPKDPAVMEEYQRRMAAVFKKHQVSPLSPFLGAVVQAPIFIGFFFAIRSMADHVPSFKEGGALWFTDLSATDPFLLLPIITSATFLATVELGALEGMQDQKMGERMKWGMRCLGLAMVPLTASFPTGLFAYWIPANIMGLAQSVVFKIPGVKEALGIPKVNVGKGTGSKQVELVLPQSSTSSVSTGASYGTSLRAKSRSSRRHR